MKYIVEYSKDGGRHWQTVEPVNLTYDRKEDADKVQNDITTGIAKLLSFNRPGHVMFYLEQYRARVSGYEPPEPLIQAKLVK